MLWVNICYRFLQPTGTIIYLILVIFGAFKCNAHLGRNWAEEHGRLKILVQIGNSTDEINEQSTAILLPSIDRFLNEFAYDKVRPFYFDGQKISRDEALLTSYMPTLNIKEIDQLLDHQYAPNTLKTIFGLSESFRIARTIFQD